VCIDACTYTCMCATSTRCNIPCAYPLRVWVSTPLTSFHGCSAGTALRRQPSSACDPLHIHLSSSYFGVELCGSLRRLYTAADLNACRTGDRADRRASVQSGPRDDTRAKAKYTDPGPPRSVAGESALRSAAALLYDLCAKAVVAICLNLLLFLIIQLTKGVLVQARKLSKGSSSNTSIATGS
jgi:hypothetical protein